MGSRAGVVLGLAVACIAVLVLGGVALVTGGGGESTGPSATPSPELTTAPPATSTVTVTPTVSPSVQPTATAAPTTEPTTPPTAVTGASSWVSAVGLMMLLVGAVLAMYLRRKPA